MKRRLESIDLQSWAKSIHIERSCASLCVCHWRRRLLALPIQLRSAAEGAIWDGRCWWWSFPSPQPVVKRKTPPPPPPIPVQGQTLHLPIKTLLHMVETCMKALYVPLCSQYHSCHMWCDRSWLGQMYILKCFHYVGGSLVSSARASCCCPNKKAKILSSRILSLENKVSKRGFLQRCHWKTILAVP